MEMVRLEPPAELTMSVGETMFTQRATRRLDPNRPVTDAQLEIILNAASKAPNGGPRVQSGQYLVIRERNDIAEFGKLYHEAWWAKRRDAYGWNSRDDMPKDSPYRHAALLADEIGNAPAVILVYSEPTGVAASSTFHSDATSVGAPAATNARVMPTTPSDRSSPLNVSHALSTTSFVRRSSSACTSAIDSFASASLEPAKKRPSGSPCVARCTMSLSRIASTTSALVAPSSLSSRR